MAKTVKTKAAASKPVEHIEKKIPLVVPVEVMEEKKVEVKEVKVEQPAIILEDNLGIEEKILKFIESRTGGEIRMNEFLKSLYGISAIGQAPKHANKTALRSMRKILSDMQRDGKILITDNKFLKLGATFYKGEEQVAEKYNLDNINISVKK
jgi:hypothetical protein